MKLEALTQQQCEQVRIWRNAEMEVWRTPFMLTQEMQAEFYQKRICDRNSEHRYWAICTGSGVHKFLGMGGITYIQWENRIGEITLIIDPERRGSGEGEKVVDLLLDQAFNHLNLQTVFAECYACNKKGMAFWFKINEKYTKSWTELKNRKYWNGQYYNSGYFSIDKDDFNDRLTEKLRGEPILNNEEVV